MQEKIIKKSLSSKVLMAGNYYKHHHPGGISAVVDYWSRYIEDLQYYPTFKESNQVVKLGLFFASYLRMFFRMLLDKNIRIVHLHTAADGSFWRKVQLLTLAKKMHKKVVLHIHASRFEDFFNESCEQKKSWILSNLNKADVLICLSESWKIWFESIGVKSEKIIVLHNITADPLFLEGKTPIASRKVHFLFMGEIGPRKGVFDILRGLTKHRDELKDKLELRIGGNKMECELHKAIEDGHLEDCVKFEGWVSGKKKIELLNWADVFILPSFNEGLPISILEAMSYGHPIISTPVGGIPEVVETELNGVIVTPGDDEAIVSAIKKYIEDKSLIDKEGNESLRRVSTYLPRYVMENLKSLYEELLR